MILTRYQYEMYFQEFYFQWHEEEMYLTDADFNEELNNYICDCLDVEAYIVEPINETIPSV